MRLKTGLCKTAPIPSISFGTVMGIENNIPIVSDASWIRHYVRFSLHSLKSPRGEMDITTAFEAAVGGSNPSEDTLDIFHNNKS